MTTSPLDQLHTDLGALAVAWSEAQPASGAAAERTPRLGGKARFDPGLEPEPEPEPEPDADAEPERRAFRPAA